MMMQLSRTLFVLGFCAAVPVTFAAAQERGFFRYSSEIRQYIEALGSSPIASIPVPVLLGVEVSQLTKNFGDPRAGGDRTHQGLDILAPEGTPIVSPTDAVVTRTGTGASSGLYVRTANPGGETFVYMHLTLIASGVTQGTFLKRGDVLGFVGNTGNASGGPAHLHFEMRKDGAMDPYPRLTQVFTLAERMQGVTQSLERGSTYASVYASKFRATFEAAAAEGLPVPQAISLLLGSGALPVSTKPSFDGELVFGRTNSKVLALQRFLIAKNSGVAGTQLKNTGATGYFGSLTQAALTEYQRAAGLAATGVVDEATYLQVSLLNIVEDSTETEPESENTGTAGETTRTSVSFTRDLEFGMKGEDVRALQKYLNAHGFPVAADGDGSSGKETIYFGGLTRTALSKYQTSKDITPAAGYFGPKTRASFEANN